MRRLESKITIVTGGAMGIGRATATAFAREGAVVILGDVNVELSECVARDIAAQHSASVKSMLLDVSSEESWNEIIRFTLDQYGRLDVLVNNAGIQKQQRLEDITLSDWRRIFSVNTEGPFLGTKAAVQAMKSRGGGSIVNVSSTYAMVADGLNAHYCASKAAVRNFTKAAALYCADHHYGIRVNSVHPGVIMTPMVEREIEQVTAARGLTTQDIVQAEWQRLCPLGIGDPQDIANGILYLASDESRYVTGSELVIDGGHLIR